MSNTVYEIIKGRFEFDNIRTDDDIAGCDITEWYIWGPNSDRANEDIIDCNGDHLTADGIFHDSMSEAQTAYDRGAGILTGYVVLLQCAEYDNDGDLIQADIIRSYAEPVKRN